jgi:hypothetical protein
LDCVKATFARKASLMKVITDIFPVKELKGNEKIGRAQRSSGSAAAAGDRVTLSNDDVRHVIDENRTAAEIELIDLYKAEEAIANIRGRKSLEKSSDAEIRQMDGKKVLFLALD